MGTHQLDSIDSVQAAFAAERYVADRDLATAVYLSLTLDRPLLIEGEAGVGKTEVGRTLAGVLKTELIRLQCYEGLDVNTAVYEWDYPRQMLEIRLLEARGEAKQAATKDIFSEEFLIRRPLLRALENSRPEPPVLLIDEVDRADEEFEAYLLEVLADFAITIPEIGTIKAPPGRPPHVIITSNRTREVHDALKRRCLYHWIDYPSPERELAILEQRRPDLPKTLATEVVAFVQRLRAADLTKVPGIAETIDWAAALDALGAKRLEAEQVERTLGALLKYQEDVAAMKGGGAAKLVDEIQAGTR
jgi:MoxR-like ATPase